MQAAGANATKKQIEEISLCGMFLLEAGKKADQTFNVPPASTSHTVRDATEDIRTHHYARPFGEGSSRGHRSAQLPIHRSNHQGNGRQSCQGLD